MSLICNAPNVPSGFYEELYQNRENKYVWPSIVRKYKIDKDPKMMKYVAANFEAVFNRFQRSEEGMKSWSENASNYYATRYPIKR
jgi:hypothetical protein